MTNVDPAVVDAFGHEWTRFTNESLGDDELAEMFELSVSACKMRISRARTKLKERFPEHEFGADDQ